MKKYSPLFDFSIDNKYVSLVVCQHITRQEIPYVVHSVGETSLFRGLFESQCCHIGIYHNLCGRTSIGNPWLYNDRLHRAAIEACKTIEGISGIRENGVMHQKFIQQTCNASTIKQVVHFVNDFLCNVCVVFMATGAWNAKVEYLWHRNPKALRFGELLGNPLFCLERGYICFASSTLRFIYSAKSLEFIGDCCDAAIFRFLRSVTSLWNRLRYVMIHRHISFRCKGTIK